MNEMERMRDLVARLNAAAKVYYQGEDEIMTNFEYDALYDELVALEEKTGVVLSGSPTSSPKKIPPNPSSSCFSHSYQQQR